MTALGQEVWKAEIVSWKFIGIGEVQIELLLSSRTPHSKTRNRVMYRGCISELMK
jgi:hypothetical protein